MASPHDDTREVTLAVYDLSAGLCSQMSASFLGQHFEAIYHTGVLVDGDEIFYGGGVQRMKHDAVLTSTGRVPLRYITLGRTTIPNEVLDEYLADLGQNGWRAQDYNLMRHNCLHFSDAVAEFLVGRGIPDYIVKLPERILNSPGGAALAPLLEGMMNSAAADPFGGRQPESLRN